MKKALIVSALAGFTVTFLQHDIKLLQEMGYEVHCAGSLGHRTHAEYAETFGDLGAAFHQIDFASKSPFSRQTLIAMKQLRRLIKEQRFDVIHCHTPIPGVVVRATMAGQKIFAPKKTKIIYTTHGFYFHKTSDRKSWLLYYPIEKLMSLFGDAIITINEEDFANAKRMWSKRAYHINGVGFDCEKYKSTVIDRNAYRESLGIDKNDFVVLSTGELSDRKNHQIIIKAIAKLGRTDICYVICGKAVQGQGTYDQLTQLARATGVKLMLLGHRPDIPEICHCADIGAFPSTREGLGLSGLEMLASGLPVVSSNVHGIMDYMADGVNGYTISPYDVDGFASAINRLLDKDLRNSMRQACVESAAKFDKSISHKQMQNIYSELLGDF